MGIALWWIADLVMLLGVGPVAIFLMLRIIMGLGKCHRGLVSISASARAVPGLIPPALGEVVGVIQTAESLLPKKSPVTSR